jgi:hypothetical protein
MAGMGSPDAPAPNDAGGESGGATDHMDRDGGQAGRTAVQTRAVISVGEVTLEGDDLAEVRAEIDRMIGRYGGFVADERTSNDEDGVTDRSVLTLRVPSRSFASVMSSFDDFATVTHTGRKATDVTTEVIDVDSRIRTQEVSLSRLRRFLGRATDVETMIRIESEIADREADLASLRAQQEYLDDQTSLATITVTMTTPEAAPPSPKDPLDDAGFLAGLQGGWNALLDIVVVVATVVGALIPFAVVLALVLGPLAVWLRTARRRRTAAAPPA